MTISPVFLSALAGVTALDVSIARLVLATGMGVALAVAAIFWLRHVGAGGRLSGQGFSWKRFRPDGTADRRIDLVSSRRIRPGWDVVVLRSGNREFTLLMSAAQVIVLSEEETNSSAEPLAALHSEDHPA